MPRPTCGVAPAVSVFSYSGRSLIQHSDRRFETGQAHKCKRRSRVRPRRLDPRIVLAQLTRRSAMLTRQTPGADTVKPCLRFCPSAATGSAALLAVAVVGQGVPSVHAGAVVSESSTWSPFVSPNLHSGYASAHDAPFG